MLQVPRDIRRPEDDAATQAPLPPRRPQQDQVGAGGHGGVGGRSHSSQNTGVGNFINRKYTLIPSPGPTGNFYQSVYFNQALTILKRCFTVIFLCHINLRLMIMTYNKNLGTFVK